MEKWVIATVGPDTTNLGTTVEDLKLMMAEHIIMQYGGSSNSDAWSILAETKVGVRRTTGLLDKLRTVFSST